MNKFYILTKILLKNSWSTFGTGKNRRRKNIIYISLITVGVLPMVVGIGTSTAAMYDIFVQIHREGILLSTGFTSITLLILVFGIFYVINIFYFAQDIDKLLPLPIRPAQLISAKFCVTLIYEYLTVSLFLLPLIIAYGIKSSGGFLYYFYSLLLLLVVPVIPLIFSSILVMILMRFSNLSKKKDQFRIAAAVFGILLVLFINYYTTNYLNATAHPEKAIELISQGQNTFTEAVTKVFPAAKMAVDCLLNYSDYTGLINLIFFYLLNASFMVVFLILGEIIYLKGAIGGSEVFSERKLLSKDEIHKTSVKNPLIKSYMLKEIKILLRTPAFFINCILTNVLWPFILVIAYLGVDNQFEKIHYYLQGDKSENLVLVVALMISMFMTASNGISSSAISREGSNFFVNKFLPVSYNKIIFAKLFTGFIISFLAFVMILLVADFMFDFSVLLFVSAVLFSIPGIALTSQTGLLLDLNFPKLNWDNEYKPVKQNMNVVISIFISIITGGMVITSALIFQLSFVQELGIIGLILLLLNVLLFRVINNKGIRLIQGMDI
jgi:ABC-2 type transport system permease protein